MKITSVSMMHADAGWRPWSFVKMTTDDGLIGWSECTESNGSPRGMEGVVHDMAPFIVGKNPDDRESIMRELRAKTRQSPGSVVHKALGGIENALLDIQGKATGMPVYALFGGVSQKKLPLYWSHCGTSRVRAFELIQKPQIRVRDDVLAFGEEVKESGFGAIKTNIGILGDRPYVYMPGFGKSEGSVTGNVDEEIMNGIETWVNAMRDAVGDDIGIALDLNFNFNADACIAIAEKLSPFRLSWLEIDMYDPDALKHIVDAVETPVVSCENVLGLSNYLPYFAAGSMDIASVDVIWNGFSESVAIAREADTRGFKVVPHNYNGHLSTFITAQWAALAPNLKIMEYDVDDVPWRNDLFTNVPSIEDGHLAVPDTPGWGCDVNEDVVREHPWPRAV